MAHRSDARWLFHHQEMRIEVRDLQILRLHWLGKRLTPPFEHLISLQLSCGVAAEVAVDLKMPTLHLTAHLPPATLRQQASQGRQHRLPTMTGVEVQQQKRSRFLRRVHCYLMTGSGSPEHEEKNWTPRQRTATPNGRSFTYGAPIVINSPSGGPSKNSFGRPIARKRSQNGGESRSLGRSDHSVG